MLAIFAGVAPAAQDKYTVNDPNDLALADFRGYESWWGYVAFDNNAAADTFCAETKTASTTAGYACHSIVKAKDYIFHSYQKR